MNPAPYIALDASGPTAVVRLAAVRHGAAEIAAWFAAPDLAAEKTAIDRLNKAAMDDVVYIPDRFFKGYQAWRKTSTGVVKAPFPVFWDVKKA